MEDISDVYLTEYIPTIYTTPCVMEYKQNGKLVRKEFFMERNGVKIIVYNKTRDVLVLVKQFRACAYLHCIPPEERKGKIDTSKYPPSLGVTLEFCAGLEDKEIPSDQIAREEILEECGYKVEYEDLEKIGTYKNQTITTGARTTWYYCEVTDEQKVSTGGGVDDEIIDVIEMPVAEVMTYISEDYVPSPCNFLTGMFWFLYNKYKK